MNKICSKCEIEKPIEDFCKRKSSKDGYNSWCRKCANKSTRDYSINNPEKERKRNKLYDSLNQDQRNAYRRNTPDKTKNRRYKYEYGITLEDYKNMYNAQEGRCAICLKFYPVDGKNGNVLCVDHNHFTDKARGLLCRTCNQALGLIKESTDNARRLIEYLDKYNKS